MDLEAGAFYASVSMPWTYNRMSLVKNKRLLNELDLRMHSKVQGLKQAGCVKVIAEVVRVATRFSILYIGTKGVVKETNLYILPVDLNTLDSSISQVLC